MVLQYQTWNILGRLSGFSSGWWYVKLIWDTYHRAMRRMWDISLAWFTTVLAQNCPNQLPSILPVIGLREKNQEPMVFNIKYGGVRLKFSLKPIHWILDDLEFTIPSGFHRVFLLRHTNFQGDFYGTMADSGKLQGLKSPWVSLTFLRIEGRWMVVVGVQVFLSMIFEHLWYYMYITIEYIDFRIHYYCDIIYIYIYMYLI